MWVVFVFSDVGIQTSHEELNVTDVGVQEKMVGGVVQVDLEEEVVVVVVVVVSGEEGEVAMEEVVEVVEVVAVALEGADLTDSGKSHWIGLFLQKTWHT